jgi:hypothetical protein
LTGSGGDWTKYTPVEALDPTKIPNCDFVAMRYANPYFAEVAGVVADDQDGDLLEFRVLEFAVCYRLALRGGRARPEGPWPRVSLHTLLSRLSLPR